MHFILNILSNEEKVVLSVKKSLIDGSLKKQLLKNIGRILNNIYTIFVNKSWFFEIE